MGCLACGSFATFDGPFGVRCDPPTLGKYQVSYAQLCLGERSGDNPGWSEGNGLGRWIGLRRRGHIVSLRVRVSYYRGVPVVIVSPADLDHQPA